MKEYKTIEELERKIIEYIDYNNKRIKRNELCSIQSSLLKSCLVSNQKMSNFLRSVQNFS